MPTTASSGMTASLSWSFIMPTHKQTIRVVGYPRVSDESIKIESTTIESQARAIRKYLEQHPEFQLEGMYPEAMTAYMKPFKDRHEFMKIMDMARKGMIDGVIVTEFSRLSRRQGEQAVIVELLRGYNVKVYSCTKNFDESALGQFMRAAAAFSAESEREKVVYRTNRGMQDRIEAGNLTGRGRAAYGYRFADGKDYSHAMYVIYGPEAHIVHWMFEKASEGWSHRRIARTLTEQGVSTQRMGLGKNKSEAWNYGTVGNMLTNPYYAGRATVLRYKKGDKGYSEYRGGEGEIKLPEGVVPAIVSKELYDRVQQQLQWNREYASRNNRYPDTALMRSLVKCGICDHNCQVNNHMTKQGKLRSEYRCKKHEGREELIYRHCSVIETHLLDTALWEKAVEFIRQPHMVRGRIEELRCQNQQILDVASVEKLLQDVKKRYMRLFDMAEAAEDEDTFNELKNRLSAIEKEKRELESLLKDADYEEEQAEAIEKEITRFEEWADAVRPYLGCPTYLPTFEEKRAAILILGMRCRLYPTNTGKRFEIDIAPPNVMKLLEDMGLVRTSGVVQSSLP